jgi:hypothetical protein
MSGKKKLDVGLTAPQVEASEPKVTMSDKVESLDLKIASLEEKVTATLEGVTTLVKEIGALKDAVLLQRKSGVFGAPGQLGKNPPGVKV